VEAVFGDWLGSFNARLPPGQGVSDNPSVRELLKGELQEGHRPDYPALLARLVLQGARSESSAVRVSSVSFAYELGSGVPGLDDLPAQAARDPVPQVRWVAVASLPWQAFPRDAQIALLTDASLAIQRSAFQKCQDPEVLVEALEHLPPARQEELFLRLEFPLRKHPAVLRRLWSTVPAASPLAAFCFEELKGQDVDVLLEGVTHPQATVSDEAVQILKDLPYPEDLRSQLFNSGVGTRAGLQARLREHRDEVADALRRAEIQRALAEVHTSEKVPPEIGERLAALGARDELREMVLSNDQAVVLAGAGGLATLGDGDGLRRALQSTPYPELLFADAIRAGLLEDVLAVASAAPRDLGNALRKAGRPELLADVFQRRPDLARTWQGDAGTVDTLLDTLAGRNDPDLLLQAVDLYDSPRAASLLVTGGHYPQVFEHLPHWRNEAQKAAVESLRQLTGIPAQPTQPTQAPWPQFRADQEALVQAWQTALRSAGDR